MRNVRKRAADADMLRDMLYAIVGDTPRAVRNRALLAIGMAGAFRRSELVEVQLDEVAMVPEGIRILIGRFKTDQESVGAEIAIPEARASAPSSCCSTG